MLKSLVVSPISWRVLMVFVFLITISTQDDPSPIERENRTAEFRKTVGDADWVPSLDLYERFNQAGDGLKELKQDVIEAFRWDIDCAFLNEVDRAFRVRAGRCPPEEEEEEKKFANSSLKNLKKRVHQRHERHERKRFFLIQDTKKHVLNLATFGALRTPPVLVSEHGGSKLLIIEGHWLTLRCPISKNETKAENGTDLHAKWIVNGNVIEFRHYEWRIKVDVDVLELFPVVLNDTGIFECWFEDQFRGFVEVEIVTRWESVRRGLVNYLKVNLVYIGLFAVIIFSILKQPQKVFKKEKQQKWTDAYLEHKLGDNVRLAKENIARKYYGDDLEKQKAMLRQKEFTTQETAAINRRILQTILDGCQGSN